MATPIVTLNSANVNPPRDWEQTSVLATFDKSSVQASITTSALTFVNDEKSLIYSWWQQRAFEGMPITWSVQEGGNQQNIFNGIIDFSDAFKVLSSVELECKIKSITGINLLENQLSGISYSLIEDKGFLTRSDYVNVPYIVDSEQRKLEELVVFLSLYSLLREAIVTAKDLAQAIAIIVAGIGGLAAAILYALATLASLVLLIIQITKLLQEIKSNLWPEIKYHKGIKADKLLSSVCDFVGLTFKTTITILNELVFLKTPKNEGTKKVNSADFGYPDVNDTGYIALEFFEVIANVFHAKYTIIGNECWLVPLINDSFWLKKSTFTLPDLLQSSEQEEYNINELNASLNITFATDTEDRFTVRNYSGTGYEVQTNQTNLINKRNSTLRGVDDVLIPYSLGSKRDKLTPLEGVIKKVFKAVDDIVRQADSIVRRFGGSVIKSNLAGLVSARLNVLKVTSDLWSTPKLMRMSYNSLGYILDSNYRNNWSAEYLYVNYHIDKSFVSNGNRNQWRIVNNLRIPFGFSDFVKLTSNSYFYTHDGKEAKAEKLEWVFGQDYAIITYRYREVYNTKLVETFIST